ncbi:DUF1189 domain-containing protein [Rossellomorea sp. BNER]|jgi:hypothetical protein|uniref:DUF1189 domain-containing protein n=1 Tax=Rossellomorea sp. BNER TaxID=2962031 RepID=UPI003AF24A1B|nr:DUF1189 domain-containing protein [Rossellomorea sp. BNER]
MNIFKQLVKSLYSPKDIAKFRFQGIGKTILYVFFLVLISLIPTAISITMFTNTAIEEGKQTIAEDLPDFTINNGKLTTDSNEPVEVRKSNITFIVDSTGKIKADDLSQETNAIALLQNEFAVVSVGNIQTTPYSMLEGLNLDNEQMIDFLDQMDSLKGIFLPVIILILYLFSSAMAFIKVSIFAFIGLLFANILKRKLTYRHSFRLTAYSITLATIFFSIMNLLNTFIPGALLLDWIVTGLMLYLSIKEIPQKRLSK